MNEIIMAATYGIGIIVIGGCLALALWLFAHPPGR